MTELESMFVTSAKSVLRRFDGDYVEARRQLIRWRDDNSEGTPSFMFHNVTLKTLERLKASGEV